MVGNTSTFKSRGRSQAPRPGNVSAVRSGGLEAPVAADAQKLPDIEHRRRQFVPSAVRTAIAVGHAARLAAFEAALGASTQAARLNTPEQDRIEYQESAALASELADAMDSGHAARVAQLMQSLQRRQAGPTHADPRMVAEIVAARSADGTPRLFHALRNGCAGVVAAFMEGLKGLRLSPQQVAEIAAARLPDGTPGLFVALQQGDAATVSAFLAGLKGLGLSLQQMVDLVSATGSSGTPGLRAALSGGHADAVTAFMNALHDLGIDGRQLAGIVEAKGTRSHNALHRAYRHGHVDAARAFEDALDLLQQRDLLSARQADRIVAQARQVAEPVAVPLPAVLPVRPHPVSYSSVAFLTVCGVALFAGMLHQLHDMQAQLVPATEGPAPDTLQPSTDVHVAPGVVEEPLAQASLLEPVMTVSGPEAAGRTLQVQRAAADISRRLHAALARGSASGTAELMQHLKNLGLGAQQLADSIAARDPAGDPGLFFALHEGHAAAVAEFMYGLAQLGLNAQQVLDLVTAKEAGGTAGLYFALENNQAEAVRAFMTGLPGLSLSREALVEACSPVNPDGHSGLVLALDSDHVDTVTAFMDSLGELRLSPEQVARCCDARRSVQGIGNCGPRQWAAPDAGKAYADSLTRLYQMGAITAELMSELEAVVG